MIFSLVQLILLTGTAWKNHISLWSVQECLPKFRLPVSLLCWETDTDTPQHPIISVQKVSCLKTIYASFLLEKGSICTCKEKSRRFRKFFWILITSDRIVNYNLQSQLLLSVASPSKCQQCQHFNRDAQLPYFLLRPSSHPDVLT